MTRRRGTAAIGLAALVTLPACTASTSTGTAAGVQTAVAAAAGGSEDEAFDAATRDDAEFNELFTHEFADVDGVRMHYVTGGSGPPVVLLHGWPQSWFAWRDVMPALAEEHTVYAVDLPGLGDSEGAPTGYDKATLARYVHGLVADRLGLRDVDLVAHDLGAGVAFQYAAQQPDQVARLALLDPALVGPALDAEAFRTQSWHTAFHTREDVPEAVVANDVPDYLDLFFAEIAYGGLGYGGDGAASPFDEGQTAEFARTYSRPQVLNGGFELYRAAPQDEIDNEAVAPVTAPTLLLTAEGFLEPIRPGVQALTPNLVRATEVPGTGHWLPEEDPETVSAELLAFLDRP